MPGQLSQCCIETQGAQFGVTHPSQDLGQRVDGGREAVMEEHDLARLQRAQAGQDLHSTLRGGRNQRGSTPVTARTAAAPARISANARRKGSRRRFSCSAVWLPSECPSAWIRSTNSGYAFACHPSRKKLAVAP
jgi:hypothetical protein